MLELSEVKKDLQAKEDLINVLQSESQKLQYVHLSGDRIKLENATQPAVHTNLGTYTVSPGLYLQVSR